MCPENMWLCHLPILLQNALSLQFGMQLLEQISQLVKLCASQALWAPYTTHHIVSVETILPVNIIVQLYPMSRLCFRPFNFWSGSSLQLQNIVGPVSCVEGWSSKLTIKFQVHVFLVTWSADRHCVSEQHCYVATLTMYYMHNYFFKPPRDYYP